MTKFVPLEFAKLKDLAISRHIIDNGPLTEAQDLTSMRDTFYSEEISEKVSNIMNELRYWAADALERV